MYSILYLPCLDFFGSRQRPHHLLWEMSKLGFNVVYCNITQTPTDFLPLSPTFDLCCNINSLDYDKEYIMWLTHGPYAKLLPAFKLKMVISDFTGTSVDEFSEYAIYAEEKIRVADLVFVTSEKLLSHISTKHPRCYKVKDGVNFEHFATDLTISPQPPVDLIEACSKPVIGFWGSSFSWIDFDLINYVASIRNNYNFVFLGPPVTDFPHVPIKPNIYCLGPKVYEILPFYAKWFDVAIIPFPLKSVPFAANPVKAYEYFACGLPVVSSFLPELKGLADIKLARTPEEFVSFLDWAVYNGKTEDMIKLRIKTAKLNSWKMRAVFIAKRIRELV